ncbi:MAG: AMP-binding protein [Thermodesulfobacteriota bacterium]
MKRYLKHLIQRLPPFMTDWAGLVYDLVPPRLRYGPGYTRALELFRESDWWDTERLVSYQESMLRRLIDHCYANVPYYTEVFDQAGLSPKGVETISDLEKLPFLTKDIVRTRKPDLLAVNAHQYDIEEETTSGSTGAPLGFSIGSLTRAMERALSHRHLLWLGYEAGDRIAEIKVPSFRNPDRLFRYYPVSRELRFNFLSMDDASTERVVAELQRFRPAFIKVFPSSLYVIARWMHRHNKSIPPVKYVITSSESLYPSIQELAREVFRAPVIDHYGQNENVATAFQCAEANGYHVQMEQCVIELTAAQNGSWEIVGTSLDNYVMPLLRYKTGDLAVRTDRACPCGRKHSLISGIKGREVELIATPEGKLIESVAMDYAFHHLDEIKEAQIIQEDISTLRVRIVPWETASEATKDRLQQNILSAVQAPGMRVFIETAAAIPRTSRGKRPFILTNLKPHDLFPPHA